MKYKTKILTEKQFKNLKHKVKVKAKPITKERTYYYKAISNKVFNTKDHFIFYHKFNRKVPHEIKRKLKELNIGTLIILDYEEDGEAIMSLRAFRYSNIKGQKNKQLQKIYNLLNLEFKDEKFIRTSEKVFKEDKVTMKSPKPIIKEIIFGNGEGHFDLVSRPHLNFLRGLNLSAGLGKTIPEGYLLSHINLMGEEINPIKEMRINFLDKEEDRK